MAPAGLPAFTSGDLLARLISDVDATQDLFIKGIAPPAAAALVGAGAVVVCLVILARQEVRHCWEHYKAGTYTIDLVFTDDVVFQLRDVSLDHVLASEALRVIREAIQYRHRRRQPWNIFN